MSSIGCTATQLPNLEDDSGSIALLLSQLALSNDVINCETGRNYFLYRYPFFFTLKFYFLITILKWYYIDKISC